MKGPARKVPARRKPPTKRAHRPRGGRQKALVAFARQARGLKWSRRLLVLLLEELYVGEEFEELLGPAEDLPASAYPQAIAVAIALRHSWRPDDLHNIAGALASGEAAHQPKRRWRARR